MTMLQKLAELMEYSHLLDRADECEDPYMRLVYASSWAIYEYYAYKRTWKPFNPVLGETYENINHGGITFLAEQARFQAFKESVASIVKVPDEYKLYIYSSVLGAGASHVTSLLNSLVLFLPTLITIISFPT